MRCFQRYVVAISLFTAFMLGACAPEQNRGTHEEQPMINLGIDLQEGFEGDEVVIDINGKEIFRQEKVVTKLLLGYAETMTTQVPQGHTTVKISLPGKNREKTLELDFQKDAYLGISLTSGGFEDIVSDQPFFYQ